MYYFKKKLALDYSALFTSQGFRSARSDADRAQP